MTTSQTNQFDLIVIGAGGAGLSAAIEAASRGMRVAVVDSASGPGGTASTSGGGTFIAASPLHEKLGYVDSPEAALEDWLAWGGDTVDVPWAERYIYSSVSDIYDWLGGFGVEWEGVQWQEGNRVPRWHAPKNGGFGVMQGLEKATRDLPGVDWRLGSRLIDLIVEGGRVTGVSIDNAYGSFELRGGAVLMATGGFNSSREMVERWGTAAPKGARILLGGGPGAKGLGHGILERAGAQFVNMESIWFYPFAVPDPDEPSGERGLVSRNLTGEVWVNRQGRRFHNETKRGGATGAPALFRQDPASCWSIVDARIVRGLFFSDPRYRRGSTTFPDAVRRLLEVSPDVTTAGTIAELAAITGLDEIGLTTTIRDYNRRIENGEATDPDFGRDISKLPAIAEPPFYALRFYPLARKNLGGVRTNLECQVLDTAGNVIPGLYAAGEVAGMAGGSINGRYALEGTMFGPSVFSGRVAGKAISQ